MYLQDVYWPIGELPVSSNYYTSSNTYMMGRIYILIKPYIKMGQFKTFVKTQSFMQIAII